MRKVTYGAGASLDNRIAGPADEVDWLRWTPDVAAISARYWAGIDTVLMGRRTWEVAVRAGTRAYPGVRNCVFSRSLPADATGDVEIIATDVAAFVERLKAQPGKGICVLGGGQLAAALFAKGLIDEVGVNVHPVLLGEGLPFHPPGADRVELELLECQRLQEDCVHLLYRVKRDSAGPA